MINFRYLLLLSGCLICISLSSFSQERPVDLANPLIDTHHSRFDYFTSATRPFGMVALSPDTKHGNLWDAGYRYGDEYIFNFSHVHNAQTAGIPIMPIVGECRGNKGLEAHKSRFSHEKEVVKLGYHKVFLEDYGITAELTATNRVGMHRYSFPPASDAHILLDLGAPLGPTKMSYSFAKKINDYELEGYSIMAPTGRRKKPYIVYFVAKFDKPFAHFSGWKKTDLKKEAVMVEAEANIIEGEGSGIFVTYKDLKKGEKILTKVAISYVSTQHARMNMKAELDHWDFEQVVAQAQAAWNDYLGRIEVTGGTHKQRVKLYTDLMHTASKRIASDVDGSYADWTGPQPVIRQVPLDKEGKPTRPFLDGDGLWGTQWNLNILWSLVYPEYGNWMAETFLDYYRNAGTMARTSWGGNYAYVMVGDHATPLLAALTSTGRATFDLELAYDAARKNAFVGGIRDRAGYESGPSPAGGGMDWYVDLGYVPVEIKDRGDGLHRGGTSMTLEYAYQDWCLASMAELLGHTTDAKLFKNRAENWKNVFDPKVGWARQRHISGEWMEGFSPIVLKGSKFNSPGFIEGNSAIYSYYVPQDMNGLVAAMGGNKSFIAKLDSNFLKTQPDRFVTPHGEHAAVWIDYENQPSCQMAHLFSHAKAPWKTQYWVRQVKELSFGGTDPYSGYNGDEDQGQMGALGVLMAIGLFDVQGAVGKDPQLEITSPVFDSIKLRFPARDGAKKMQTFEIVVQKSNPDDIYIQQTKLNGKKWNSFEFSVDKFFNDGHLEIELGPKPNKQWGIK